LSKNPAPTQAADPRARPALASADRCPVCSAELASDQDWCLRCGAAARTRLAPPPPWRPLVRILSLLIVASLIGLAIALAKLVGTSGSGGSSTGTSTTTTAAALAPPIAVDNSASRRAFLALHLLHAPASATAGRGAPAARPRAGGS
jgi:hypothetical protein